MFSSRLDWRGRQNRLSRIVEERRISGAGIVDITESNPTRAGIDLYGGSELLEPLSDPASLIYEPHPRGLRGARECVAEYYRGRGTACDAESIWLTASTSESYGMLLKMLADPGDEILAAAPSYPLFDMLAALEGVRVRRYALWYCDDDGWRVEMDSVAAATSERTRALFLVSPNNPTGSYVHPADLALLVEWCGRRGIALVVDEVFYDFALECTERVSAVAVDGALCFTVSGISKVLALPQMKLGWIHVSGPADDVRNASSYLDLVADSYLSVSAPVQHAVPTWMRHRVRIQERIMERIAGNLGALRVLERGAEASPWRLLRVEGGWYAVLRAGPAVADEEFAAALLDRDGILIHPGYFFDFGRDGYLVASLLTRPEDLLHGIDLLSARLRQIG